MDRRTYDPEHDALWAAVRGLRVTVACLMVSVVLLAMVLLTR
jgi:hypothetical protein